MRGRTHPCIAVAVALLPGLALAVEDAGTVDALVAQLESRRLDELLAQVAGLPQRLERDQVWVAALALHSGPEAAVQLAGTLATQPRQRAEILVWGSLRCLRMREYDAARKLVQAAVEQEPTRSNKEEHFGLLLSTLFTGLRRHEDLGIVPADPRFAVLRLLKVASGVSQEAPGMFADEVGSPPPETFGRAARPSMDSPALGPKGLVLPPEVILDMWLAVLDFTISGEPALGWRVRLRAPYSPGPLDLFVVPQADQTRLLGMVGPRVPPAVWGVGNRAGALVEAGELAGARQWIEWARESLGDTRDGSWARFFVSSTPDAIATADGLRTAASALATSGSLRLLVSPGAIRTSATVPVVPPAVLPAGVVPFSQGMSRPVLRSSPNGQRSPDYPLEVREAGVSGMIIVRCILSVEGKAEECTIVKPLVPSLDREVLDWLARSTWSPVTLGGKPQRVSYVFNFNFRLDPHPPAGGR
ncbi:MAG TPA: energy transducer TonB [Myxococcaceae bacterium]|nr:energy transducer TonB [Myxococcaceae bacterium]